MFRKIKQYRDIIALDKIHNFNIYLVDNPWLISLNDNKSLSHLMLELKAYTIFWWTGSSVKILEGCSAGNSIFLIIGMDILRLIFSSYTTVVGFFVTQIFLDSSNILDSLQLLYFGWDLFNTSFSSKLIIVHSYLLWSLPQYEHRGFKLQLAAAWP